MFSVLKPINMLIGRHCCFTRALQTMSWNADISYWTKCMGCTTIISGDGAHKWHRWCSTCCSDPKSNIDATNVRVGLLDKKLADHREHFGDFRSELDTVKVDIRLTSAFTAAVQLEMQSLREHSQQMSALHQGMQTQINSMQADAVQQQRQTEDLQAQINNTKTVDLQHKLVSVKVDAVELNKVQLDKAKVDAAQLSDMQGLEEWMQTHIISMQVEMKGEIDALQTQVKDLNLERQTQIDGNKDRLADAD